MTNKKLVGTFLLLTGIIFSFKIAFDIASSKIEKSSVQDQETATTVFEKDFKRFLHELSIANNLPAEFRSIQYVKYSFNSNQLTSLFGKIKLPLKISPDGLNYLELDFISVPDSLNKNFIVQLSLFEIKTKNKLWENSNLFRLNND